MRNGGDQRGFMTANEAVVLVRSGRRANVETS